MWYLCFQFFWENPISFSTAAASIFIPTNSIGGSPFSTSSVTPVICILFSDCLSDTCEVTSHGSFDWFMISNTSHTPGGYPHSLFGKRSIQFFCAFLDWVVYFFDAELHETFIFVGSFFLSFFEPLVCLSFFLAHAVSSWTVPAPHVGRLLADLRCPLFSALKSHVCPELIWTFCIHDSVQPRSFLVPHCFNDWCLIICFNTC